MTYRTFLGSLTAFLALNMPMAWAQVPPLADRPIKMIVPFAAGTGTDIAARLLTSSLSDAIKRPIIIENRPGALAVIGTDQAAKSPPDGLTLVATGSTAIAAAPSLFKKLPYDPVHDLAPVSLLATASLALFVGNEHPAKTLADLIALARKEPGKLSYASGNATGAVAGELLKQLAGVDIFHVPYKAAPQALNEVASGAVTMMFNDITGAMPLMRAGKLRALAVTSRGRARLLPDIASLYESGYTGYELYNWVGIFAPAKTSTEIIRWYAQEIGKVTASAGFKEGFERVGLDLVQNDTPAAFTEFVRNEIASWTRLIQAAGLQPE